MKNKKSKILIIFLLALVITIYQLRFTNYHSFAQDSASLVKLSKQIIEAKSQTDLYPLFAQLQELYFQNNQYTDYVEFLKSLSSKKKTLEPFTNYYIALSRYRQLKYLEESQSWDEYFSHGNSYRQEIMESAQKAIDGTSAKEPFNLYARLVLWQLHRGQHDALSEQSLSDLLSAVSDYAKEAKDYQPIKNIADEFFAQGEKAKSQELYKIYVEKIINSDISIDKLKDTAYSFYQEGNLDLAELFYDVYIEKILPSTPKEKVLPILIDIAKEFSYKDKAHSDPAYAEKVFKKIEKLGQKEAFSESSIYLRAFNLEKIKEYSACKDIYLNLVEGYPDSVHFEEANFKIGMIYTYALADIKNGKAYFEKIMQKETPSAYMVSSLYQLGLLSQWEGDLAKAGEYYNKITQVSQDDFQDTSSLAKERLKEIEDNKPIEYNLKTFLDISLKEENKIYDMAKLDLKSSLYKPRKEESVHISSTPYLASTGCMQVELAYLWSGHLGPAKPTQSESFFDAAYKYAGTKEINLVVISPAGVIDRSLEIIDID